MAGKKSSGGNRTGRVGGRDNKTGEFVPIDETKRRPATTTREIIPLPGHGDSGRYDKPKR